jgi:hypothetical protein
MERQWVQEAQSRLGNYTWKIYSSSLVLKFDYNNLPAKADPQNMLTTKLNAIRICYTFKFLHQTAASPMLTTKSTNNIFTRFFIIQLWALLDTSHLAWPLSPFNVFPCSRSLQKYLHSRSNNLAKMNIIACFP